MNLTIGDNVNSINFNGNDVQRLVFNGVEVWSKVKPIDYENTYLTFEIVSAGTLGFYNTSNGFVSNKNIYYRKNGGSWTLFSKTINVDTNDIIEFYANSGTWGTDNTTGNFHWGGTSSFNLYGNIRSLRYGVDFMNNTTAWSIGGYCFYGFFKSSNVIDASNLIIDVSMSGTGSCWNMFRDCKSLTHAPQLRATSLANYCYSYMFSGCTSLINAPELPATTLANYCYQYMFKDCTSLTTAPILPATTLVSNCYNYMFQSCTLLNYIKALFTTKPSSSYTNNWVSGVAASGTFVKNSSATYTTRGVSGIPNGWTVQTASS